MKRWEKRMRIKQVEDSIRRSNRQEQHLDLLLEYLGLEIVTVVSGMYTTPTGPMKRIQKREEVIKTEWEKF